MFKVPSATRATHRTARRRMPLVLVALIGLVALAPQTIRADDPPCEGGDTKAKVEEKMREILKLMRENGRSILEASKGGAEKSSGVTVEPLPPSEAQGGVTPRPPDGGMTDGGTPPPQGMSVGPAVAPSVGMNGGGAQSGESGVGSEIGRRMEELVERSKKAGGAIPRELEELIRMIPP